MKYDVMLNGRNVTGWAYTGLVLFCIVVDQVTKHMINACMQLHESWPIAQGINFTLVYNRGASFSLLSQASGWQRWFFISITLIVVSYLLHCLGRTESRLEAWAYCLMIAGALGNFIDRVFLGYVIDFIDLYYHTWSWPVFNVADSAVCVGAALLLIHLYRAKPVE